MGEEQQLWELGTSGLDYVHLVLRIRYFGSPTTPNHPINLITTLIIPIYLSVEKRKKVLKTKKAASAEKAEE